MVVFPLATSKRTMKNSMTAGQIKEIRTALGMTGDALAEMLGVTGNTVRRWECGARQAKGPAVAMLRRMFEDIGKSKNGRKREIIENNR